MIPDPRIVENIKKLKDLGMSKEDIKDNLIKMGLSSKDCDELISNAFEEKKITVVEPKKEETNIKSEESPKTIFNKSEIPDNLFSDETEIAKLNVSEIPENKDETKDIPDITKGLDLGGLEYSTDKDSISFDDFSSIKIEQPKTRKKEIEIINTESNSTADVWQTGLVTTINTKINEVEIRQAKMEEYLKSKIDTEIDKYKQIQETTKQLLMGRISEQVSEQISGVSTQLTKQLAMLKVEQAKMNKKYEDINASKQEIENLLIKFQDFQNQMTQTNKVNQDNVNRIIATTTVKLNAKIKEINDILALQSKITQGLIKNTQTAVVDEIKKLNEFKEGINKQINPQQLYDKLNQLESFKQQLANRYELRFDAVKNEFLSKARDAFKDEITKELAGINKVKDTIVAKTDPEIINRKLKELESFETQLINAVDEKISQSLKIYQSAITQEIKGKINTLDEEIKKIEHAQTTIEIAKEKINELNMFRDQFIAIIDKNIEKINNTYSQMEKKIKDMEERQKSLI